MKPPAQQAFAYVQRGLGQIRDAETDPRARARRAQLAGARGVDDPAVWPIIFTDRDGTEASGAGWVTDAELVAASLLCSAARHHKRAGADAFAQGKSLGAALGALYRVTRGGTADEAATWNRYRQMIAVIKGTDVASKVADTERLLRAITSDRSIGLDYPRLASDLIRLGSPDWGHQTQISWGRDFWSAVAGPSRDAQPSSTATTEGDRP